MKLRVIEFEVEATPRDVTMEAKIIKCDPMTGKWEDYGIISTSDVSQMNALSSWYYCQTDMTEDELFRQQIGSAT